MPIDLWSAMDRLRAGDVAPGPELDEILTVLRAAFAEPGHTREQRWWIAANLERALGLLPATDVDELVAVRRAVADHDDVKMRYWARGRLAGALALRFERDNRAADLDEAIAIDRDLLIQAQDFPDSAVRVTVHLSYLLRHRPEGLAEAVELARGAAAAAPEAPIMLGHLGDLMRIRFESTGRLDDIDEAVDTLRTAVRLGGDHEVVAHLADALRVRFQWVGAGADLDEAVDLGRRAVAAVGDTHPNLAGYLSRLSMALLARHEWAAVAAQAQQQATGDLDECVTVSRWAVRLVPPGHVGRGELEANLSTALRLRYHLTGAETDLDEAVRAARNAVAVARADSPAWTSAAGNLATVLTDRYQHAGAAADLDDAVLWGRLALETVAPGDPCRWRLAGNLGLALMLRYARADGEQDWADAIALLAGAAAEPTASTALRCNAAVGLAAAIATHRGPAAAADAHRAAVELLPLLAWRGVSQAGHHELVRTRGASLARDAAACAIAAGRVEEAVELLELGRGCYWAQMLPTRTDLTGVDPDLAARLTECRAVLERAAATPDERVSAARRFDSLVEQVRALPGHESFLRLPVLADLLPSGDGETVVIVNVSRWRCDAILLTSGGARLVPLPELTAEETAATAGAYLEELERFEGELATARTLGWLWRRIAAPVLDHLDVPDGRLPRVWWCLTGPLAILPVWAAGDVPERAVSSVTPSLRALREARQRPASDGPLLVVALPQTPGKDSLDGAADEIITLAAALHHTGRRHVIGTVRSVGDEPVAQLTAAFHRAPPTADPACALHAAVRELRERYPDQPSFWAPFLHMGP